jgi:ATP-dependent RNA helicase RhlE
MGPLAHERFTLTDFQELGLSESVLRAVLREGYTKPTPIQGQAIPRLLAGDDLVGIAQTGTGKTAAFVLPILQAIEEMKGPPRPRTCRALIVAPTRELAAQIVDSVRTYGRFVRHSVTLAVGGVRPGPQIKALAGGVDVLVATPGRLLDHMSTGAVSIATTRVVVLDEADQMMDLGFLPAIRKVMRALPAERQTLLFSATMPKEIRALANDFLKEPVEITVAAVGKPVDAINQKVIHIDQGQKQNRLLEILQDDGVRQAIVFTRTKRGADRVSDNLLKSGLRVGALHGNKSQGQRDRTLGGFRTGKLKILVATDIAARGIDVDDVSHVINFELPHVPEAYVHRIGRTARAGKDGIAVSLCDPAEAGLLRDIEKLIKRQIPAEGNAPAAGAYRSAPRPQSRRTQGSRPAGAWRDDGPGRSGRPPQIAKPSGNGQRRRNRSDNRSRASVAAQ